MAAEPRKGGLQGVPLKARAVRRRRGEAAVRANRKIEADYFPQVMATLFPILCALLQCDLATPITDGA